MLCTIESFERADVDGRGKMKYGEGEEG